ncbi:MAG: DAHL domain-containing protein, partial [Gammaproteobacteria bacterium]
MALTGNKQALVIVFALALITILYVKTEAVTPETHTWIVNHLREIEHQEALLNQDTLKARSGLLPHVDSLVSGIRRVSTLIGETREAIHRMFGAGDHEIATAMEAVAEQFAKRVSVIEDFKSDNAVLSNSLGYFTFYVAEISSNIRSTGNNDALAEEIENLRLEILDYYISGDSARRLKVESRIQSLPNLTDRPLSLAEPLRNIRQQAFEIRPLLVHANAILDYRDRVTSQVINILSKSSTKAVNDTLRIVNEHYAEIQATTNKYRLSLYAVSFVLLSYVSFILIKLRQGALALRQSEERFRYTFENAPVGVSLITPEGHRFKVNKALADFLGYSVEELTDTTIQSTAANLDDLGESMRLRQQVLDGEITTYRNERRYRHKQGHVVWGEACGSLFRNEDGEPEHFITHTIDITERKRAEEALLDLAKFPSENPNPVLRVTPEGGLLYANDVAQAVEGLLTG